MHPEDQDRVAHSVPAPEPAQGGRYPSPDPSEPASVDAQPAANQTYQSPVLAPGVVSPVQPPPNAIAKKHRQRVGWLVGIGVLLVASIVAAAIFSTPGADQNVDQSATAVGSGAPTEAMSAASPAMSLPSSAGGLVLLSTSQAQTEVARMRQHVQANQSYAAERYGYAVR